MKDLKGDELLWGDEIEYGIFKLDRANKKIRLSLRAKEVRFCPNQLFSVGATERFDRPFLFWYFSRALFYMLFSLGDG